jgi:hypothetical protein
MIQQTREWNGGEYPWKLTCPLCGFDYVHITALKCLRQTDETVVTKEGTFVRQSFNDMRGVKTTIQYRCENGHVGEIILQFHKGCVYLAHKVLPEAEVPHEDIWRD